MNTRAIGLLLVMGLALAACRGPREYIDVTTLDELPPVPYVYTVHPGDIVKVEIAEDGDYDWEATVLPDGSATFRWVGELQVMGLTLRETRELLREQLADYYVSPSMTMYLKRIQGPDPIVFIGNFAGTGDGSQTTTGGIIPWRRDMGVMEAIARAGGPGEPNFHVAPYLYVIRNIKSIHDRQVYRYDLLAAVRGEAPDIPLHPGDVIFLDQSWLQNLDRALGISMRVLGGATAGATSYLIVDRILD